MHVFYPGDNSRLSAYNVRIAAKLAQKDINNVSDILEGYELVLEFSDTQVSRQCLPIYGTNGLEWGDLGHLSIKHLRKLRYFFRILVTHTSIRRGRHSPHRCVWSVPSNSSTSSMFEGTCPKLPLVTQMCDKQHGILCSASYLTNCYKKVHMYVHWCDVV